MRKLLLALLALALLATPAAAAEIQIDASVDGEPVDGETVTVLGITTNGTSVTPIEKTTQSGSATFTGLEAGRYVAALDTDAVTLRGRAQLAPGDESASVTIEGGSAVAGTVTRDGEPVEGATVTLTDFFGVAANTTTAGDGTFRISPVPTDLNLTLETDYRGHTFTQPVSARDEEVEVQVTEPTTDASDLVYRSVNDSRMHSARMAIVDFDTAPVRVSDYYSVYNPADRPFNGEVPIRVPTGATVAGVNDVNGNTLQYILRNSTVYVDTSISPRDATTVGIRYSTPGSSVDLTAHRYTESAMLMIAAQNGQLNDFQVTGPLQLRQYGQGSSQVQFMANATDLDPGTEFGLTYTGEPASTESPGGASGGGGDSGTRDILLAVGAAVVVVGFLVYTRQTGGLPSGDGSLADKLGGGAGGDAGADTGTCPECGTESTGSYCPECGSELRHEQEDTPKYCPGCGDEVRDDDAYCPGCGQEL